MQIRSEGGAAEGRRQGGAGGDRDVQDEAGGALRHLQGREEQGQRRPLGEGQQGDRRRARRDQDAGTGAARAPPRQPTRAPHAPARAAAGEHQQGRGDQDALAVGDDRRRLEVKRRSAGPRPIKLLHRSPRASAEAHVEDHHHDEPEHQPLHRQRLVAVRL